MPTAISSHPYSPYTNLIRELSRYLTPHRYRKKERKVAAVPDFIDVHRSIAHDQHRYLDRPRRNYARPRGVWMRTLAPAQAHLLSAANMEARIAVAEIALRHLRLHRELYQAPLHFVTVSPAVYIRPLETASRTDLRSLQKLTGQALHSLSFIGAPDFALFKAWGSSGIKALDNHVGPHTHNIVFGASRAEIEQGMLAAGLDSGGWTGGAAYHIKEIAADDVEGYLLYLLKAPLFFYHARQGVRVFRNRASGEEENHALFKAHPLRTGDQLRMAAVVHEMYVDELLFGQGAGTVLARDIRAEAREPLRRLNEVARRQGKVEISTTVGVKVETRPLLSACITEPVLSRLLRRWSRVRAPWTKSTSSGSVTSAGHVRGMRTHDPLLDDLDGEI